MEERGGGDRKTGDLLLCGCGRGCASLPSISASIAHPLAHSRGGGIDTFVLDIDAFPLFLVWWVRWSLVASIDGRSSRRGRRVDRVGAPPSFAWKGVHPFRSVRTTTGLVAAGRDPWSRRRTCGCRFLPGRPTARGRQGSRP